ncbi:MAG: hypothetical protein RRA94_11765 [Bacteroidota bacterium]|nr:hypothetical protein [Bacteroidota bacterium]
MNSRQAIPVEIFLDGECSSTDPVLAAVDEAARSYALEICLYYRDRHAEEFLRRGIIICPATYIAGMLAFYGPMSSDEITHFIEKHVFQPSHSGEIA